MKVVLFFAQASRHLFVPAEKRIPRIRIETRQAEALEGTRLIVVIDSWPRQSRYPLVSLESCRRVQAFVMHNL